MQRNSNWVFTKLKDPRGEYQDSPNKWLKNGNIDVAFSIYPSHKGWYGCRSITELGGSSQKYVDETAHDRGVQTILCRQLGHNSVGNTLWNKYQPHTYARYQVRHTGGDRVGLEEGEDGQAEEEELGEAGAIKLS